MLPARAPGTGCKECRYHHVCDPEAHYRPRERRRASSMASSLNSSKLSWTERSVPRFVERELRSFLDCGVPAHGFLRVHCDACGRERPVAFSNMTEKILNTSASPVRVFVDVDDTLVRSAGSKRFRLSRR